MERRQKYFEFFRLTQGQSEVQQFKNETKWFIFLSISKIESIAEYNQAKNTQTASTVAKIS